MVEAFVLDGQQARLTQAALETLAVVAYKQPVSRARVSAIRGVNVDGVMRTLRVAWAGRGGGPRRRARRDAVPDHGLLPRADRDHLDRGAAGAGALPARHGRPRGRAGRGHGGADATTGPAEDDEGVPADPHPDQHNGDGTEPTAGPRSGERRADDPGGAARRGRAGPAAEVLAQSGVASRRKCEELMLAGVVEVDGEVVTRLGTKVDPAPRGSGCPAAAAADHAHVYLVLNKPRGVVSTMSDPQGRPYPQRLRRRPARAAVPRRPPRHRHRGADHAHQRRRLRPPDGAPVVRGRQDVRRRGRGGVTRATLKRLLDGVTLEDGPVPVSAAKVLTYGEGQASGRTGRAGDPRGPQPDRTTAAGRGRPPGPAADPHPDRAGRLGGLKRGSCASSRTRRSAPARRRLGSEW